MQSDATKTVRSVVPRWRSLNETPGYELTAHSKQKTATVNASNLVEHGKEKLQHYIKQWEANKDLISAADLLDAATIFNAKDAAREAASFIVSPKSNAVPALRNAASAMMSNSFWNEGMFREDDPDGVPEIRNRIRSLKSRLKNSPRDSIATVELARMYALSGQQNKTEDALERAAKISPDNRYVLRSITQFFSSSRDIDKGLHFIWKSDAVRHDAWIQSAEVALIAQTSRGLKFAGRSKRSLLGQKHLDEGSGELAVGLAGLDFANGAAKKHVRRLVDNSLSKPTENGLAQAIWIGEHANLDLPTNTLLKRTPRAHEAEYYALIEGGYFIEAVRAAKKWHWDQPLSADAVISGMYVNSILLGKYNSAIELAISAERSHGRHFMLNNCKMVAQALGGRVHDARKTLHRMEQLRKTDYDTMFVEAGKGLTSFQLGNFETGRFHYEKAIELARKSQDHGAQLTAFIFWLEQEVKHGCMGYNEFNVISSEIDRVIKRLSSSRKKDLSRLWKIRRSFIIEQLAQTTLWHIAADEDDSVCNVWDEINLRSADWN